MASLNDRQINEVSMAIKHLGRAMKALQRASLPDLGDDRENISLYMLHRGQRLVANASDALIDGMMIEQGMNPKSE